MFILKRGLTVCLLLQLFFASSQNLHYQIIKGESQVGTLEVKHKIEGDLESFSIRNLVELKLIFTFSVEYVLTETFRNGILESGDGFNSLNGSVDKRTSIEKKEDGYSLLMDGIAASGEKEPIKASISQIYHKEPYHNMPIYSQYFGNYLYAQKVGEHQYKVVSPDGENIYTYESGYCKEVVVSRDFATIYIRITTDTWARLGKTNKLVFEK